MNHEELQAFRLGFCKQAAELGMLPSELLAFSKRADVGDVAAAGAKGVSAGVKGILGLSGLLALLGGGAGALGSYYYNKAKFEVDPEDNILPEYTPADEAKNIHLLAKYRNAKKMINSGLA